MSKENNLTDFLTDIADEIRLKKGQSINKPIDSAQKIDPQTFSGWINELPFKISDTQAWNVRSRDYNYLYIKIDPENSGLPTSSKFNWILSAPYGGSTINTAGTGSTDDEYQYIGQLSTTTNKANWLCLSCQLFPSVAISSFEITLRFSSSSSSSPSVSSYERSYRPISKSGTILFMINYTPLTWYIRPIELTSDFTQN